jgi:hypothetical protein
MQASPLPIATTLSPLSLRQPLAPLRTCLGVRSRADLAMSKLRWEPSRLLPVAAISAMPEDADPSATRRGTAFSSADSCCSAETLLLREMSWLQVRTAPPLRRTVKVRMLWLLSTPHTGMSGYARCGSVNHDSSPLHVGAGAWRAFLVRRCAHRSGR